MIFEFLKYLDAHPGLASWASAIFAFLAALVALFIAIWGDYVRKKAIRPKLEAEFNVDDQCMRDESFAGKIKLNYLLKINNSGLSTAKNAMARVEKIEYIDPPMDRRGKKRIWYHPTPLNWSGQQFYQTIDIYKDTSFFLDFILSFDAIVLMVECGLCPGAIVNYTRQPSTTRCDYFWQPWLDAKGAASIPNQFLCFGVYEIYFHLACDELSPVKYIARVEWHDPTPIPSISLKKIN